MKGDFTRRSFRPEKRYSGVYMQQGRVQLDADWNEQVEIQNTSLRTALTDLIGAHGAPTDAAGSSGGSFRIDAEGKFLTVARGRYYVEGVLCDGGEGEAEVLDESLHMSPGLYVAVLDCWEHHVTAVEDPYLREIALGGPDTCTRSQIRWKVRLVPAPALAQQGFGAALRGDVSSGRIRLKTLGTAGYLRPDNSHYRIEIHSDCDGTQRPAFKWSRSNASLTTVIQSIVSEGAGGQDGVTRLRLELSYQEDNRHLRLGRGQWIEISEEERVLAGLPGLMAQITTVDGTSLLVELSAAAADEGFYTELMKRNGAAASRTIIARQWDGFEAEQEGWLWELRADGISVEFEPAQSYRAYDYWMIPARSQTGELDWPYDTSGNPEFALPTGVRHYLAPLADLRRNDDGTWTVEQDRRRHFHAAIAHKDNSPKPPPLPRLRIRKVLRLLGGDDAKNLRNNDEITVSELASGVCLICDAPIVSPIDRGNCLIAVELPFPRTWWQKLFDLETEVGAYLQMVLTGEPEKRGDSYIAWRPTPPAIAFLQKTLDDLADLGTERPRILARWTVKGNLIYGLKHGLPAYLDGEVFGKPGKDGSVELDLALDRPSGDGRPGGTFEMWFWIKPDPQVNAL